LTSGPGHGHSLLLAARELGRLALGQVLELDELQSVGGLGVDVLDAAALEAEGDVLLDVQVREEGVVLEHRVDRTLGRAARR
jgi:hypothetical protein